MCDGLTQILEIDRDLWFLALPPVLKSQQRSDI